MFRISVRTTYGVLAVLHLGSQNGQALTGQELSQQLNLPAEVLLKVLQQLVRARVLDSKRGRNGGFSLSRGLEQISLREVLEAVDGPISGRLAGPSNDLRSKKTFERLEAVSGQIASDTRLVLGRTMLTELVGE